MIDPLVIEEEMGTISSNRDRNNGKFQLEYVEIHCKQWRLLPGLTGKQNNGL